MTAVLALIHDAYRELHSRKLFWIVLVLSVLFVTLYASIGFDETGMFLFFGLTHVENELLTAGSPMSRLLYRGIFATFVVPIWLAWIATILALISTAPIFPEFLASGSVDLVLCKPISRLKLFFWKYVASLLFVILQVSVFCLGVFLAIGWRLGDWDWRVFVAVPLITLFYSYLYSFCVLIGVWTRSTLAALLLTFLMWFGNYSVSAAEALVTFFRTQYEVQVEGPDHQLKQMDQRNSERTAGPTSMPSNPLQEERDKMRSTVDKLAWWEGLIRNIRWPLPKTSETVDLQARMLSREGDINLMDFMQGRVTIGADDKPVKRSNDRPDQIVEQRMLEEAGRTSPWFIIGTSVLFELVMLSVAAWIFSRRDF